MKRSFSPRLTSTALILSSLSLFACEPKQTKTRSTTATAVGESSESPKADRPAPDKNKKEFSFAALEHPVTVGQESSIAFEIKPGAGLKINPEYPWKALLDEGQEEGALQIALEGGRVSKGAMTLEDKMASIPVKLTAKEAGEHELMMNVSFSVCEKGDSARCLWFTDEPVTIRVKASQ